MRCRLRILGKIDSAFLSRTDALAMNPTTTVGKQPPRIVLARHSNASVSSGRDSVHSRTAFAASCGIEYTGCIDLMWAPVSNVMEGSASLGISALEASHEKADAKKSDPSPAPYECECSTVLRPDNV